MKRLLTKTAPIAVLVTIIIVSMLYVSNRRDYSNYAIQDSLLEVQTNLFTLQAAELDGVIVENNKLKQQLERYKSEARMHIYMETHFKVRVDTIATYDTLIVYKDSSAVKARYFEQWPVPDQLYLKGYFQIQEPYNLHFEQIRLTLRPEILLAEDRNGVWTSIVDTHSDFLKISDIRMQISPKEHPFADLKPEIFLHYSFIPYQDIAVSAQVRVWKLYPYGRISANQHNTQLQLGVSYKLW